MKLIRPSSIYQQSYRQYITELADEERYPFPLDFDYENFPALLKRLEEFKNGINLPEGFVPSSTYWLVKNGELIGVSNLRHYLNDSIRECGGHIGLGIRPSFRGQGLSTQLLCLTIHKAKAMDIKEVHIHCHKHNQASVRMIVGNGGLLDSEFLYNDIEVIQRFII